MNKLDITLNPYFNQEPVDTSMFDEGIATQIMQFHKSFPLYKETPLRSLKKTAHALGLQNLLVKDESFRFGLNAFKALGGSYAIAKYLSDTFHFPMEELTYEKLVSDEMHALIKDVTFITATDGNHGRGVAWTARQLGVKAIVYMPKGSSTERLENIRKEGAYAQITDMNYDDTVRFACKQAQEHGFVLVQDTSWDGYEKIPTYIMQGYMTMAYEAYASLPEKPSHIFIQAGVGSLAAAICGFFYQIYGTECPKIIIVEAKNAECIYKSIAEYGGSPFFVDGELKTIMAGLACGEPCTVAFPILKNVAFACAACPDYISANGMRLLGNPLDSESSIVSGESGAVTTGLVYELCTNKEYDSYKKLLELNESSCVLCFSTEGATDLENYRDIVWNGAVTR